MNKLLLIGIGVLLTSTTYSFFGAGCTLEGDCSQAVNKSRPANVTILSGQGASRRISLSSTKRLTAISRDKTREETSSILQREKPRYRGSREAMNTSIYREPVEETWLEKAQRTIKARREAKRN